MYQESSSDKIASLEARLREANAKLKILRIGQKDCEAYVLGRTGAGKSTFISCMISNDVTWKKNKGNYHCFPSIQGPAIGNNPYRSQTVNTESYEIPELGKIRDNPGIFDTKGYEQDIVNCYLVSGQFKATRKIKLIIMIQNLDFQEKGINMVKIFNLVYNIFKKENQNQLARSCLIVVSKIPEDCFQENQLQQEVIKIVSKHQEASLSKNFIKRIIEYNGIVIFPEPQNGLAIKQATIKLIKDKILKLSGYQLKHQGSLDLTSQSKEYLRELANKTEQQLQKNSQDLTKELQKDLKNSLTFTKPEQMGFKLGKITTAKAIIIQTMQRPQTITKIHENLLKLKIPQKVITKTVESLHNLQVCQSLNALKMTEKKKNMFINKLLAPITTIQQQIKKSIRMNEEYRDKIKSMHLSNSHELDALADQQSYFRRNAERESLAAQQKLNSIKQMNQTNIQFMQQHEKNQLKNMEAMQKMFEQTKWQNYKVEITEETICSIM